MGITKDINIYELLDKYPQLEDVLEQHGLACVGCPGATMETIEQAASGHSIDLEKLLEDINKEILK